MAPNENSKKEEEFLSSLHRVCLQTFLDFEICIRNLSEY